MKKLSQLEGTALFTINQGVFSQGHIVNADRLRNLLKRGLIASSSGGYKVTQEGHEAFARWAGTKLPNP